MTGLLRLGRHPVRVAFGTLAMVSLSLAYVPAPWHGDHAADKDCGVCKHGNRPMAELSFDQSQCRTEPHQPRVRADTEAVIPCLFLVAADQE